MVRPVTIILAAIPILAAIFIVVPQLIRPEIPITAVNADDVISVEYSKQHLKQVPFGVTESIGAEETDVLTIQNDGEAVYSVTKNGYSEPDIKYQLDKSEIKKLTALVKETGFMEIPDNSYPVKSGLTEYDKFGLQITLNDKSINIQWPEQNASEEFVPPIIDQVKSDLDGITAEIIK